MKRTVMIFTIGFACLAMFLTYPGGWTVADETTPEAEENFVNFNKLFHDKLFVVTDAIKNQMGVAFQDTATKINDFNFDFENQSIEQIIGSYQDYVDDLADNYLLAMYKKINDPQEGLQQQLEAGCPSWFENPLSNPDCAMQTKEEDALNRAAEVLEAIAQEYQRNIKRLGTKFTIDSGLLAKDIELRKQALSFEDLPRLTVKNPEWIKSFEEVKKNNFWDDIGNVIITSAKNAGTKLFDDFKQDVSSLAGKAISGATTVARDQIKAQIDRYTKDFKNIQDKIVKKFDDTSALISSKIKAAANIIMQSSSSFMNYIQLSLNSLVSDKVIKPVNDLTKSILDKADNLSQSAEFLDSVASSTKKNIGATLAGIISTLDESLSLLVSDEGENPGVVDRLENSLTKPLDSLQKSIQSSLSVQINPMMEKLPSQTKNAIQVEIDDLENSLVTVVNNINEDVGTLSQQLISPIKDAVVQIKDDLKTVASIDLFGDFPENIKKVIQDKIKNIADEVKNITTLLGDQFQSLKDQITKIIKDSSEVAKIITDAGAQLGTFTNTVLPKFEKYVNEKTSVITNTLNNISNNIDNLQLEKEITRLISDFGTKGPLKTLNAIKDEILCQDVNRTGLCKTPASKIIDNITTQLNPQSIGAQFNSFIKEITDELNKVFQDFKTSVLTFLQTQQTKITSAFNQGLSTTQVAGKNLNAALANIPNELSGLLDEIKKDALQESSGILQKLDEIKGDISSIRDTFSGLSTFDQAVNSAMDHKDALLSISAAIPAKIDKVVNILKKEGEQSIVQGLIDELEKIKSDNAGLSQVLGISFSDVDMNNIVGEITGESGGINSLVGQISDAAENRVGTISNKISDLKGEANDLIALATNAPETIKNKVFETANNLILNLDPDQLDLISNVKSVVSNSNAIKDAINRSATSLNAQVNSIQQSDQNIVATFDSEDIAEQMQVRILEQLPASISQVVEILPEGNAITIEPNVLSVTSEEFSVLFDDMKEVLTGLGADKQGDFINALKMLG